MNIRFYIPDDVVDELDEFVQNTMPEGYGTTMVNIIRYTVNRRNKARDFTIFIGTPDRLLDDDYASLDPSGMRDKLLASFTAGVRGDGNASCWYNPSVLDVAYLQIHMEEAISVQQLILPVEASMLPMVSCDSDGSITLIYMPMAKDRGDDTEDLLMRAESLSDGDSGNTITARFSGKGL